MVKIIKGYEIEIGYADKTTEEYKCIDHDYVDNRFIMHFKDDVSIIVNVDKIKKIKIKNIKEKGNE